MTATIKSLAVIVGLYLLFSAVWFFPQTVLTIASIVALIGLHVGLFVLLRNTFILAERNKK